jgi:hypothetical protein
MSSIYFNAKEYKRSKDAKNKSNIFAALHLGFIFALKYIEDIIK